MSEALIREAIERAAGIAGFSDPGAANGEAPPEGPPAQTLDMDIDVMFHAQRVTRLHLEEPTAGQYEKAMQELASGVNAYTLERFEVSLIAAVGKVDRAVVLGMKRSQIEEAFRFLARLLASGRPTGAI
jgi:hypothetical protein